MKISIAVQFSKLYAIWKTQKLPLKLGYKLAKLAAVFETELNYYTTKFNEIIQEYGDKDNNGNVKYDNDGGIHVQPELISNCNKALDELNNFEIDVPDIEFTLDELEVLGLTVEQLSVFLPFIK